MFYTDCIRHRTSEETDYVFILFKSQLENLENISTRQEKKIEKW